MGLVHPLDAKEVLERMSLAAERQLLKETAMKFVKEDVEQREQKSKLEGKLEGKQEEKYEMLLKFHAEGFDQPMMSRLTGLSIEEIQSYLKGQGLS